MGVCIGVIRDNGREMETTLVIGVIWGDCTGT